MDNIELEIKKEALNEIAKLAVLRKTGARGLRSIMEDLLLDLMYEAPDQIELKKIIINKDVLIKKTKPMLLFTNKDNNRKIATNKS
jgi:ATP-dependent Clp protease ATP-binding subunit ClpX